MIIYNPNNDDKNEKNIININLYFIYFLKYKYQNERIIINGYKNKYVANYHIMLSQIGLHNLK